MMFMRFEGAGRWKIELSSGFSVAYGNTYHAADTSALGSLVHAFEVRVPEGVV